MGTDKVGDPCLVWSGRVRVVEFSSNPAVISLRQTATAEGGVGGAGVLVQYQYDDDGRLFAFQHTDIDADSQSQSVCCLVD